MDTGRVRIFYGNGHGKTAAALGYALQTATEGKEAFVIHFLKGKTMMESEYMQRLEPEIKVFHFEKSQERYEELSEQEQKEERVNMKNGVNFARKVLLTGECSLLVLDEILGVIDNNAISREDMEALFRARTEGMDLVLTGRTLPDYLRAYADEVYEIKDCEDAS